MDAHEERIRELTKEGAVERNEIERAAAGLSRSLHSARTRFSRAALTGAVGLAAAGLGFAAVRVVRRIRARKRRQRLFEKLGIAPRPREKKPKRKQSPSLPLTLLLLLARSPAVRRAVAAMTDRLIGRSRPPGPTGPSAGRSNGPARLEPTGLPDPRLKTTSGTRRRL